MTGSKIQLKILTPVIIGSSNKTSKVLSSYTLDLKSVITNNVDNIIDFQFLHGYTQPTLAILYEPLQTFAGRIAGTVILVSI